MDDGRRGFSWVFVRRLSLERGVPVGLILGSVLADPGFARRGGGAQVQGCGGAVRVKWAAQPWFRNELKLYSTGGGTTACRLVGQLHQHDLALQLIEFWILVDQRSVLLARQSRYPGVSDRELVEGLQFSSPQAQCCR